MTTKASKRYIFLLYIFLVLTLSWILRQDFFTNGFKQFFHDSLLSSSTYLLAAISTLFAGSIGLFVHKGVSKKISILGNAPFKNIL